MLKYCLSLSFSGPHHDSLSGCLNYDLDKILAVLNFVYLLLNLLHLLPCPLLSINLNYVHLP